MLWVTVKEQGYLIIPLGFFARQLAGGEVDACKKEQEGCHGVQETMEEILG